jgi:hypothetical protein
MKMPGIGIANTVRFAWRSKETEPFGRETFGRTILIGILDLEVKDVMCLQGNPMEVAFDVTFHKEEKHNKILKMARELGNERPMCHYEVTSLGKTNFRLVTVNMYNPHVSDEEVRAYLERYMDKVSSGRLQRDSLGFWNGRRGFQALLREDPNGLDGYLHPPAMFSLGADRGTLYYARQPPFCRRCMAYGHNFASCSTKKCRICGSAEHEAKDCDEPKACHGCGSSAHLWRDCPVRHRSYASAAGGGAGAGDGGRRGGTKKTSPDQGMGPEEKKEEAAGGKGKDTGAEEKNEERKRVEERERKMVEDVLVAETVEGGEGVGKGGREWGEDLSSFLGEEMLEMVEELRAKGACISPVSPVPPLTPLPEKPRKKKGKRRGSATGSEREGGEEGEGGEGGAKRVMGERRVSLASLFSEAPNQGMEGGSREVALGGLMGGESQLLFGDLGSPISSLEAYGEGVGGEPRGEANTLPSSWIGEMEEDGGTSGEVRTSPPVEIDQGSIG